MQTYRVFGVRAIAGWRNRRETPAPYGGASGLATNEVQMVRDLEDLADALASIAARSRGQAIGISFEPPVSVFVPPYSEPKRFVPLSKAEQKKFMQLFLKRRNASSNVRRLAA